MRLAQGFPTAICALLAALVLLAAGQARAATLQDRYRCLEDLPKDMQQLVDACTAVIAEGKLGREDLGDAYTRRGSGWAVKGDLDRALSDYDEAARLDPKDPVVLSDRGNVWLRKADPDKAIADYDQAIRLASNFMQAYQNRGEAWMLKGDLGRALHDYERAIQIDPDYVKGLNAVCWTRGVMNVDLDAALLTCNRAIRFSVGFANNYDSRALVQLRRGQFASAIADDDAALAIDPKHAPSLYVRGIAKLRLGRQSEGQADISAGTAIEPGIAKRYAAWGIAP